MSSLLNRVWRSSQPTSTAKGPAESSGFTAINAKSDHPEAAEEEEGGEESLFVDPRSPSVHEGNYIRSVAPGIAHSSQKARKSSIPSKGTKVVKMPMARITTEDGEWESPSQKGKVTKSMLQSTPRKIASPTKANASGKQRASVSSPLVEQSTALRKPLREIGRTTVTTSTMPLDLEMADVAASDDQQPEALDADDDDANISNEDESEMSEGEYEVETIRGHKFDQRKIMLQVKWKGYDEPDNTWEPEANLKETAAEILRSYYSSIGGRPEIKANVSRPRRAISENQIASTQDTTAREPSEIYRVPSPALESPEPWAPLPPAEGNWEDLIVKIDTLFKYGDHVMAGIIWAAEDNHGRRYQTRQDYWAVRLAAPNALLKYFESHVDFEGSDVGGIPLSAKLRPKQKPGIAPQANMVDTLPDKKRKLYNGGSTTTALPSRQKKVK